MVMAYQSFHCGTDGVSTWTVAWQAENFVRKNSKKRPMNCKKERTCEMNGGVAGTTGDRGVSQDEKWQVSP